jgi:hypothetical protein
MKNESNSKPTHVLGICDFYRKSYNEVEHVMGT